jgi:hypothetical protein
MKPTRRTSGHRSAAVAAFLVCGSAVLLAVMKGPDGGGYTATDETVYSFVDISGASGGSAILSGTDDGTAVLTLPFAVRFYGQSYGLACASSNGALYFVSSVGECTGFDGDFANPDLTAAPVPNDRAAILPFWSDLTFQVPGGGAVFYQTLDAAPNRRFVVEWKDAYPPGSPNPVTFEIVLSEGTDRILFQYQSVDLGAGNPAHQGALATVGIRNAGGVARNQQLQWSYQVPVIRSRSAVLFSPADSTPPAVTAVATPAALWPPNGKKVNVTVRGRVADPGGVSAARFEVNDEYGAVQPFGPISLGADGTYSVAIPLVSDRLDGDLDGRTYTIVIVATDSVGNEGTARVSVIVPHDQRK